MEKDAFSRLKQAEGKRVIVRYHANGQTALYVGKLDKVIKERGICLGSFYLPFDKKEPFYVKEIILASQQIYP